MSSLPETTLPFEMSYSAYAPHYDNLCTINPAYQDLRRLMVEALPSMSLPTSPKVCDLGAGTGNFVCSLLEEIPSADIVHLDCCPEMNKLAREKYQELSYDVTVVEAYMQEWEFALNSLDLVICVNVLNSAPPILPMLRKISSWLRPGGTLFLVDFGREIDVYDWTWYLVKHSLANDGFTGTLRNAFNTRKAFSSNRVGQGDQQAGRLWTHTTNELEDLVKNAGFSIDRVETCYRDYADLIIAQTQVLD